MTSCASLSFFHGSVDAARVGDELGIGFQQRGDDAQVVGAQGGAGLGDVHDGVHQVGDFHLRRAPTELDLRRDALAFEEPARQADGLGGDALALQVLHGADRRGFRHGEHPARRRGAGLAERQVAEHFHLRAVFLDPVAAGQPGVEKTLFDVAADFLRAQQPELQFGVVDGRLVRAAGPGNLEARLGEKRQRRLLQTAAGQADAQDGAGLKSKVRTHGNRRLKGRKGGCYRYNGKRVLRDTDEARPQRSNSRHYLLSRYFAGRHFVCPNGTLWTSARCHAPSTSFFHRGHAGNNTWRRIERTSL